MGAVVASDIARFLAAERARGLSPVTVRGRYRALKLLFTWAENCDEIGNPPNPMRQMKPPRVPKHEPRRANMADVQKLLDRLPAATWLDLRDRAIIQLLFDTGMRVSEVAMLRVDDVDLDNRLALIVAGKGDKSRRVPFSSASAQAIRQYLACRPSSAFDKHLWLSAINEDGEVKGALTLYGIQLRFKVLCKRYNVPHINAHSIRHLFGLKALNDGIRLEVVSAIMGHASVDFTRKVYAPLLTKTMQDEYARHWK